MLTKSKSNSNAAAIFPLYLAILIDGMGLGILFPILNSVIVDPKFSILAANTSEHARNLFYGMTMFSFMVAWFFGSAILGDISDMLGRKKSLMICLVGSAVGYILSAIAVIMGSVTLLIIGRVIDGFTAGSQPIAQAGVVDASPSELKTRNLGLVLFAASIGFILGPLCSGILADSRLVSWFSPSVPLYFAGILAFLNTFLLWIFYRETKHPMRQVRLNWRYAFDLFISAFRHPKVEELSVILLVMLLGWSSYFIFIAMFLLKTFNYQTMEIGVFIAVLAAGFGLGSAYLVRWFNKYFSLIQLAILAALVDGLAMLLTVVGYVWLTWSMAFIVGIANAIVYTAIISLYSEQVTADEQGWVMGISGAVVAFAFAATSLLSAFLTSTTAAFPLVLGGFLLWVTAAIAYKYKNNFELKMVKN